MFVLYIFLSFIEMQIAFVEPIDQSNSSFDFISLIFHIIMMKLIIIFGIIAICVCSDKITTPAYTEDVAKYKQDRYKERLQILVGCWLMSRQYQPDKNYHLDLIKVCLKHITRKDSVLKITSLVGKNMSATKTYQEIVPSQQIPHLQYKSTQNPTEFDAFLQEMISTYEKDLGNVMGDEGKQLVKKMDEEVEKRSKYFGIFPKNQWTHFIFLTAIALALVLICTCYKYCKMDSKKPDEKITQRKGYKKL